MNEIISKLIRQAIYAVAGASAAGVGPFTDTNIDQLAGALALVINFIWSWIEFKRKKDAASEAVEVKIQKPAPTSTTIDVPTTIVRMLVLCGCLLLAGCATPQQTTSVDVARIAGRAAYIGGTINLRNHPQDRPKYELAVAALKTLEASESPNGADLAQALTGLPVRQLDSDEGFILVGAALTIWDEVLARRIPVEQPELVKRVAPQIRSGLERALQTTASK